MASPAVASTAVLVSPSVTPHARQMLVAVAVPTPSAPPHASLLAVVVARQMLALVAVAAARQLAVARQMLREVAVHMAAARQMLLAVARQVAGQVAAMVLARQEQGQWEVAVMHAWIFAPGALMQPNCHLMQLQLGHLLQHCLLVDL